MYNRKSWTSVELNAGCNFLFIPLSSVCKILKHLFIIFLAENIPKINMNLIT